MELKGLDQVLEYLNSKGFVVSRATLFRHRKAGKLPSNPDGVFSENAVAGYAHLHLKRNSRPDPDHAAGHIEDVQREKVLADARRSKAMARLAEERARRESGRYVPKEDFDRALAARAIILKQDLTNLAYSEAAAVVAKADGDQSRIPEVADFMLGKFMAMLARYAEPGREFKIGQEEKENVSET